MVNEKEYMQYANELVEELLYVQIFLLKLQQPDLKELTFIKAPLYAPNGGQYLVQIVHVDGEKIQLDKYKLGDNQDENTRRVNGISKS